MSGMEDKCENCWYWWNSSGADVCHCETYHFIRPCGDFTPKLEVTPRDEYEDYQMEWN